MTNAPCTNRRSQLRSNRRPQKRRRVTKRKFQSASGSEGQDVYTRVTNKIVADLERGVAPWTQPWTASPDGARLARPLRHNGIPYNGVNILLLWASALEKGYTSPHWMTFKQAQELGGHVRKGEHGSLVVYASTYQKTEHAPDGRDVERDIPFLKSYVVFNVDQIEGLPDLYRARPPPKFANAAERIAHAEAFFAATGAQILSRGHRAAYSPQLDHIVMPPFETFRDAEGYYATLAHETVHWTRHESRLSRDLGWKSWGDAGYAAEELVAELGSAFLCADLEISPIVSEDHAAYIAHWLRMLKDDKKAIFTAAAHAQRAVDFLWGKRGPAPAETPEAAPAP